MDVKDLIAAVFELHETQPVVTSQMVKAWCERNNIEWGADTSGFTGRDFYDADHGITGEGGLAKWKGPKLVGWSLSEEYPEFFARAKAWAEENGWKQVG